MSSQGRPGDSPLSVYRSPDPVAVARLVESHGMDAAAGRFFWLSREGVGKLAQHGREILRGRTGRPIPARGRRRTTTPEQEAHGIAEVLRLGSVHRAAKTTGLSHSLLRTLLVERGIPVPRLTTGERRRGATPSGPGRPGARRGRFRNPHLREDRSMSKKPSATRAFVIRLDGFPPEKLSARSKSGARYAAYRAFREAGYSVDFLWFCRNVRVEAAA